MTYTRADVEAAIAKANGQKLAVIKVGGLNGADVADIRHGNAGMQSQGASPYLKGTGHTFAHVSSYTQRLPATDPTMSGIAAAQAGKSLWVNRHTAIDAALELINSPQAQPGIQQCMAGNIPASGTVWLKRIPLDGIHFGLEPGSKLEKQAETGSINFVVVGHSLFIYSCYPDGFAAGNKALDKMYDLGGMFS